MSQSQVADDKQLVFQLESDLVNYSQLHRLHYHRDITYFTGRAGAVRVVGLLFAALAVGLMTFGYEPYKLNPKDEEEKEILKQMSTDRFSGYKVSYYTIFCLSLGGIALGISFLFVLFLYLFLEVRCDLAWELINQKAHVVACVLSVAAAFCDVMSIQEIQMINCTTFRCQEEKYGTKNLKFHEPFYPPLFVPHYIAFVLFLTNAMIFSVASRIWLRNEDR